ncbi:MAG: chemotaxis protein CheW [Pseudanabaenaceae cyanobacterium]|jgi:positive phototaxis protein PixI
MATIELSDLITVTAVGDPYLCLQLDSQTKGILPLSQVQEVLTVKAERFTLLPNMPGCVLGLLGHRSRAFYGLDLGEMLGLGRLESTMIEYPLVVLHQDNVTVGLAVSKVTGVVRLLPEQIDRQIENYRLNNLRSKYLAGYGQQEVAGQIQGYWLLKATVIAKVSNDDLKADYTADRQIRAATQGSRSG